MDVLRMGMREELMPNGEWRNSKRGQRNKIVQCHKSHSGGRVLRISEWYIGNNAND